MANALHGVAEREDQGLVRGLGIRDQSSDGIRSIRLLTAASGVFATSATMISVSALVKGVSLVALGTSGGVAGVTCAYLTYNYLIS